MEPMNRREFVAAATCAACVLCASQGALSAEKKPEPVDVGPLASLPAAPVMDRYASSHRFLLVRSRGRLFAVSAICSHKAFSVGVDPASRGQLKCSEHGSTFALDGKVTKGPATQPLTRLGVTLNADKHVIVDPSRRFGEKQWANPAAFIELPT